MRIFPGRPGILVVFALASLMATQARAVVLDWDNVAWTPGSLSNSYDVTADPTPDITVAVASQNKNIWANDPTTGVITPAVLQSLTGGLAPVQNSLMIAANLHTNSNLTLQITFTGVPGQTGANNVSFTIFDIDITTNSDIIQNIYGVAPDGTHIAPTITNVGSSVTLTGSGLSQTLTGNSPAANNTANGNATISFGSTVVHDIFFTFGNTSGAPRYQDIGIGDITFTPVPEMNPAAMSVASCLVAAGMVLLAHRRAKGRESRQDNPKS